MESFKVDRIAGFRLLAPDPQAAADFLRDALQAEADGADPLRLTVGATPLAVAAGPAGGAPAAEDPAFQHLAVVVSGIEEAHFRVLDAGGLTISRGGPVQLPPASGGVTAWKFRTPDGQPLELLQAPTTAWRERARDTGRLVLGIDHTALGCPDPAAAVDALHRLGFHDGPPSHNAGPEQDRLDGLDGVDLHIRTLFTPGAGPHIELLTYVAPAAASSRAAAGLTTRLEGAGGRGPAELHVGAHAFEIGGA